MKLKMKKMKMKTKLNSESSYPVLNGELFVNWGKKKKRKKPCGGVVYQFWMFGLIWICNSFKTHTSLDHSFYPSSSSLSTRNKFSSIRNEKSRCIHKAKGDTMKLKKIQNASKDRFWHDITVLSINKDINEYAELQRPLGTDSMMRNEINLANFSERSIEHFNLTSEESDRYDANTDMTLYKPSISSIRTNSYDPKLYHTSKLLKRRRTYRKPPNEVESFSKRFQIQKNIKKLAWECKLLMSSELEVVVSKATRGHDTNRVKPKHMDLLLALGYTTPSDMDAYTALLKKLWSKAKKGPYTTILKCLYILHRISANGSPVHAEKFKYNLSELRRLSDTSISAPYFSVRAMCNVVNKKLKKNNEEQKSTGIRIDETTKIINQESKKNIKNTNNHGQLSSISDPSMEKGHYSDETSPSNIPIIETLLEDPLLHSSTSHFSRDIKINKAISIPTSNIQAMSKVSSATDDKIVNHVLNSILPENHRNEVGFSLRKNPSETFGEVGTKMSKNLNYHHQHFEEEDSYVSFSEWYSNFVEKYGDYTLLRCQFYSPSFSELSNYCEDLCVQLSGAALSSFESELEENNLLGFDRLLKHYLGKNEACFHPPSDDNPYDLETIHDLLKDFPETEEIDAMSFSLEKKQQKLQSQVQNEKRKVEQVLQQYIEVMVYGLSFFSMVQIYINTYKHKLNEIMSSCLEAIYFDAQQSMGILMDTITLALKVVQEKQNQNYILLAQKELLVKQQIQKREIEEAEERLRKERELLMLEESKLKLKDSKKKKKKGKHKSRTEPVSLKRKNRSLSKISSLENQRLVPIDNVKLSPSDSDVIEGKSSEIIFQNEELDQTSQLTENQGVETEIKDISLSAPDPILTYGKQGIDIASSSSSSLPSMDTHSQFHIDSSGIDPMSFRLLPPSIIDLYKVLYHIYSSYNKFFETNALALREFGVEIMPIQLPEWHDALYEYVFIQPKELSNQLENLKKLKEKKIELELLRQKAESLVTEDVIDDIPNKRMESHDSIQNPIRVSKKQLRTNKKTKNHFKVRSSKLDNIYEEEERPRRLIQLKASRKKQTIPHRKRNSRSAIKSSKNKSAVFNAARSSRKENAPQFRKRKRRHENDKSFRKYNN